MSQPDMRKGVWAWLKMLPLLLLLGGCRENIGEHIMNLKSIDPTVRAKAAFESAKKRSRATEFLPDLIRLLDDESGVRMQFRGKNMPNIWNSSSPAKEADIAIRIIGPVAIPPLVESFSTRGASEGDRRIDLVRYFGESAFAGLLASLASPVEDVRAGAAGALGQLGDARALPELTKLIEDPGLEVQEEVLGAIYNLGPPRDILARIIPLAQNREENKWYRRRRAQSVLCKIDDPSTIDLKLALLQDRSLQDSKSEEELLDALARIEDEKALKTVFAIAIEQNLENPNRATAARRSMIQIGKRVESFLLQRLDDGGTVQQQWAIFMLGDMKSARAVDKLIALCRENRLRHWAVKALGKIGEARSLPSITEALELELRRPFAGRRVADICEVLGGFGDKRAVPSLIKALNPLYDSEFGLVENEYEIREATEALSRLTGVTNLGEDFRKWQAWWAKNKALWPGFSSN